MTDHVQAFDRSLQKAIGWLDELRLDLGLPDRNEAYHALRAVLQVLRDRLTIEEMAELGAQLPLFIRGMYYEGWHPRAQSVRVRHAHELFQLVEEKLGPRPTVDAADATWAVFRLLVSRITAGEIADVRHVLPRDIKRLWPDTAMAETD